MRGIRSYGTYVPFHRLARAEIAATLGTRGGRGERSVAAYDEDSVTMAVEAARECLATVPVRPSALAFATTSPPYAEKSGAAIVHAALDLPRQTRVVDLGNSVRSGLGALMAAADGRAVTLATAADVRIGAPEGSAEGAGGDAAAAFLFDDQDVLAEVIATASATLEYLSQWRLPDERFPRAWEERFALTQGYVPLLTEVVNSVLAQAGVEAAAVGQVVLDAPNPRAIPSVLAATGLQAAALLAPRTDTVGHAGAAEAGLGLAEALDRAAPGDLILVASVSDGADAMLLRATDSLAAGRPRRALADWLASKRDDLSYTSYLRWRGILPTEPPRRPDPERPAAPPSLRNLRWKFAMVGTRCRACGTAQLPPQIVCVSCGATNAMDEEGFTDKKAVIRTFTIDRLAFTPQPPMVVAVVDFDGGGRVTSELTDCEPERVAIGDELEMTFRRLFTAGGVHNYAWKARPVR